MAAPAPSFSRFVERLDTFEPTTDVRYDWLPDGRTTLVFRVLDGGRRGDVCIAGPQTHARFKTLKNVTRAAILRFKPGWTVPLIGVAARELTDRIVPLADLWGRAGVELYAELLLTRDRSQIMDRISHALSLRVRQTAEPASARLARRAARLLEEGEARVEIVADRLGVTSRHLRRAFSDNIGVAPKDFARAVRLQRAMRMTASSDDWSHVATSCGYYDQAHLISDFREIIGVTPGAFRRHGCRATVDCDHGGMPTSTS